MLTSANNLTINYGGRSFFISEVVYTAKEIEAAMQKICKM
jgi:hypothetical protein